MRVHNSALKHGVLEADAIYAATWALWVEDLDDESPSRQLRLGFDTQGRLLETVVLVFDSGNELVIQPVEPAGARRVDDEELGHLRHRAGEHPAAFFDLGEGAHESVGEPRLTPRVTASAVPPGLSEAANAVWASSWTTPTRGNGVCAASVRTPERDSA